MKSAQQKVRDFHVAFDIPSISFPSKISSGAIARRMALINEETAELYVAMHMGDLIGIADGLADLLYVVLGTAVEYGIEIEPIFNEVHRSNMSKVGGTKREDGKLIKPATYSPANLEPLIRQQLGH